MNTLQNILATITLVVVPMSVALGVWMIIIAELVAYIK